MRHKEASEEVISEGGDQPSASPPSNLFLQYAFDQSTAGSSERRFGASPLSTPSRLGKRKGRSKDDVAGDTPEDAQDSPSASRKIKIYEHLRGLSDHLAPGLDIIFCGINPGQQSAQIGHHFANPTNHFWACLHESGLTLRRLDPREDFKLPQEFAIGLTNLVERPTVEQSELSRKEQVEGVPAFLDKIFKYKPYVVCFVGLGIADIVRAKVSAKGARKKGDPKPKTDVGLQAYKIVHADTSETLFYAVSSTSGRVVKYQKKNKIQQFIDLRVLTQEVKSGNFDSTDLARIQIPNVLEVG